MTNTDYTLDGDFPQPGKRFVNKVGFIERDSNGDKWLSHNKIIIKGVASEKKRRKERNENEGRETVHKCTL
jgi:hypothetical protein